ncbi:DUF6248 family natural product biosynthesis protein [Streptomyces sp. KR55]|uniref:DUF6248 family natural product biosynthesis protein n=1 Tax=Streptomyces sp. KR55 TaxID=3457425 RepID=UPI003FCFD53A
MTAPIRPQRKLTEAEWDVVRRTKLLNLHGALILGIVDPVPNPSPMPEAEGAWVREHVWTEPFHKIDRKYPWGFWRWSLCEKGTCWNCLNHRCDLCIHRQKGGPDIDDNEESVHNQHGRHVATFIPRPGGEPCMWWCRCPCPKTGEAPAKPERRRAEAEPEPRPNPVAPPRPTERQPALFDSEMMSP